VSSLVEGVGGNREVPPLSFPGRHGDLSDKCASAGAYPEEGGARGKHGFSRGSSPKASDEAAEKAVALAGAVS
jgi:hypothetical protein